MRVKEIADMENNTKLLDNGSNTKDIIKMVRITWYNRQTRMIEIVVLLKYYLKIRAN